MQFSSGVFLMLFLPITLALYKILGRLLGHRVKNLILLAASLFFYAWGELIFIFKYLGFVTAELSKIIPIQPIRIALPIGYRFIHFKL